MEGSSTSFDQLPEDIIMEILSILPVKSILKLKSVCKYWYILIQSPSFIIKHFCHKANLAIPFVHLYFLDTKKLKSVSVDEYPLVQDFYVHKSTCLKPVIGPLNGLFFVHNLDKSEMALWNPATQEIKKIVVPSPLFYSCFSGLCCSDSSKMLQCSCRILERYTASSGGSDTHTLKGSSEIDFKICRSDSPEMLLRPCRNLENCDATTGGSDTYPMTFFKSSSNTLEMLSHPCDQILQKCASASGGSDTHPSTFLKSSIKTDFSLCCSDSPEMLPQPCQILQKCAASGGSDTRLSTFLKSSSKTDFSLCCSDSPEMLPQPCQILQKGNASSGGSDTHPSSFLKSPRSYAHHFGFGMDPLSKDYKVVWIRDYFWKEETFTRSASAVVSVYSLSTDSWRHFEDNKFLSSHIIMSYFDTYLDGFYYWNKIDFERRCEILAFDFRNENFQVIQTPDVFNSNIGTLGVYDGCVSMLFHLTCIEIWVMEEFGFWTKKLVLESTLVVKRPIGYGVNGEIFLETTSSNLAMIHPRTQEVVKCNIGPLGNGHSLQVLVYKKSLVSIKKLTTLSLNQKISGSSSWEFDLALTLKGI